MTRSFVSKQRKAEQQDSIDTLAQTLTNIRKTLHELRTIGVERYRGDIINDNMKPGMKWLGNSIAATAVTLFTLQALGKIQLSNQFWITSGVALGVVTMLSSSIRVLSSLPINYRYHSIKRVRDFKRMHLTYQKNATNTTLQDLALDLTVKQLPSLDEAEKNRARKKRQVLTEVNKIEKQVRKIGKIAEKYDRRVKRDAHMISLEEMKRHELDSVSKTLKNKGYQPAWFDELLKKVAADGQFIVNQLNDTLSLTSKRVRNRNR